MGWFENVLKYLQTTLTDTLRKFVAFSVLMFAIGALYGVNVAAMAIKVGAPDSSLWLLAVPLVVAALAYVSTEFAAFIFILMLLLLLVVFL